MVEVETMQLLAEKTCIGGKAGGVKNAGGGGGEMLHLEGKN